MADAREDELAFTRLNYRLLLIGIGIADLDAIRVAALANNAPVSYGALGAPIIALAAVTGLPLMALSASVGHVVALLALAPPWILIYLVSGTVGVKEAWPLAIVGSLVMLIVGASLARAFAIAGAAGLVRYRSKIDDPKDASVMLACLSVGLASGVGLLYLAAAGAAFIVGVLWLLEWREPWPAKSFELKVSAKDPAALKSEVEALLTKHHITFELRGSTEKDVTYSAQVPEGKRTDRISEAIVALHGAEAVDVTWEQKKAAK